MSNKTVDVDFNKLGILPPVGQKCLILNSHFDNAEYEEAKILFSGKFTLIYESESCKERVGYFHECTFKPLDTRTNEQKAYQDIVDLICGEHSSELMAGKIRDALVSNKITGTTWSDNNE